MNQKDYDKYVQDIHNLTIKKLIGILEGTIVIDKIPMADYVKAYTLCNKILGQTNADYVKKFFQYVCAEIRAYLKKAYSLLKVMKNDNLVDQLNLEIEKYKIFVAWLCKILISMEKHRNVSLKDETIAKEATKEFKLIIIEPLKSNIFDAINTQINDDRNKRLIDRKKLRTIIYFFESLDIEDPEFSKEFEIKGRKLDIKIHSDTIVNVSDKFSLSKKVLVREWISSEYESLKIYAHEKSSREISIKSAPEYISSASEYCEGEDARKIAYIPNEAHVEIDKINYDFFIKQRLEALSKMATGIAFMFENDKQNELASAFNLYNRLGDTAIKILSTDMAVYIKDRGNAIFNDKEVAKDPTKFIPALIKLKLHMDNLVDTCFKSHLKLSDAKAKAFTSFMGKEHYSKQLANFCDFLMKVGLRGKNENQTEEELNNVINLFKCMSNKIVFQVEFAKKLSERLIQNKTVSLVAEKNLVSKIRADQGVAFTNKMTNMFEDLEKSVTTVDNFRKGKHRGVINGINMNCQILQQGAWEIEQSKFLKLDLSNSLKKCIKEWEEFYKKNFQTHKLLWVFGIVSIIK